MNRQEFLSRVRAGEQVQITETLYLARSTRLKINGIELSEQFESQEHACQFGKDNGLKPQDWQASYIPAG